MPTEAFVAGLTFKMGTQVIEQTDSVGGIGVQGELVDATSYDSGNVKEYVSGLKDGKEVSVEAHLMVSNTGQDLLSAACDAGDTESFELELSDGTNTLTVTFDAVCLGWEVGPSKETTNMITWQIKISGPVTRAVT